MSERKDPVGKRKNDLELGEVLTPDSPTWIYLHGVRFEDHDYAAAYREAKDRLVRQLTRDRRIHFSPDLFMPILYLYRHSLELELKNLLRFGSGLLHGDEKLSNALGQHNLYDLWNYVKYMRRDMAGQCI